MTRGVEVSQEGTPKVVGCDCEIGRRLGLEDCPRDKEVDKSEELNVFGGAPIRLDVNREGVDSASAHILRSNF